jgi:poly-gamma-glutamate synthesis protein (capsule biosynthesis protein)
MYLPHQPGCPARIFTYPYQEDLDALRGDIAKAKSEADLVVLSLHWGLHLVKGKLAGYENPVAHAAIDAGADIVFGTHAHILKGINVYKGKVIFHNLGNFAVDSESAKTWPHMTAGRRELLDEYQTVIDPEWGNIYPYPADSRKTMIAKCLISGKRIARVSFLPAIIDRSARPQVLTQKDKEFSEVVEYVKEITAEAGLPTRFRRDGDEVTVVTD